MNRDDNLAPVLNIFGGKLTTYRKLSEKVISTLNVFFPSLPQEWAHKTKL